jgi:hypothetical protein
MSLSVPILVGPSQEVTIPVVDDVHRIKKIEQTALAKRDEMCGRGYHAVF